MKKRTWLAALFIAATAVALFAQQEKQAPTKSKTMLLATAQAPVGTPHSSGAAQPRQLVVTVGKSLVLDSPSDIQRVSVVTEEILEVVAISPRELVLNGKSAGDTSLILWQTGGNRLMFDVTVQAAPSKPVKDEKKEALVEGLKREIAKELGDQDVSVSLENKSVFLRGTVRDLTSAQRASAIAEAFGTPVNLLHVMTPAGGAQILLRVKFADVDRTVGSDMGINLLSTGATGTIGGISTQQYQAPTVTVNNTGQTVLTNFTLSDALNLFLFRPDLNLGATIKMLQNQRLLQILAEPNLLATDGKKASFLSGGEFPYPVVQGGSAGTAPTVTIMFREFGIRLNFTPTVTPRGTISLVVAPEVSSLDYSNGLVYQGFNIPALSTRKVSTEVELKDGQSFAIAGLLDNRTVENINRMPGLASIPLFGKLFQSRSQSKTKTELLVVVTPEIVRPIPAGQPIPGIEMPTAFIPQGGKTAARTPGVETTGPGHEKPAMDTVPVESLMPEKQGAAPVPPAYQLIPVQPVPQSNAPTPKQGEGGN